MDSPAGLLFAAGLILYALGAALGLLGHALGVRGRVAGLALTGLALAGSLAEAVSAGACLWVGSVWKWASAGMAPGLDISFRLDGLASFFLLALSSLAAAVAVFTLGYSRHGIYGGKPVLWGGFLNLLLLSLTAIFSANNVILFLVAWEAGVGASYFLIAAGHGDAETRHGGLLFILMSRAGAGLIYGGLLLLASAAGTMELDGLRGGVGKLPPALSGLGFLLLLLGFGVKAGVIPLHVWLPAAHPVAPSNVSALMSGIVIKTGIYGIARVCFDFYGGLPQWAGLVVLLAGVVSGLLGVLYALMEHDLKRLLAFHSIENIGIILMGFGAAILLRTYGHPGLAALALAAGLFHTLNHALFKGLLFLGAGAVTHASGTRNMEEMGGLIRRMPQTALYFLVGAAAISGLPPLNGFVSEWLTYQALLTGFGTTTEIARVAFPVTGALLALTAALAAACFVKAFGITFLALPRSEAAGRAAECTVSMRAAMALLAAACIALGLGAHVLFPALDSVTGQLLGTKVSGMIVAASRAGLQAPAPRTGSVSPLVLGLLLGVLSLVPFAVWRIRQRAAEVATGPAWDCGTPGLTAENEYTATAFSKSFRMIFSAIFRPRREIQPKFDVSPYFPREIHFESDVRPAPGTGFYESVKDAALRLAMRGRQIQAGSIHAYLAYVFVTLILLLLFGVRS